MKNQSSLKFSAIIVIALFCIFHTYGRVNNKLPNIRIKAGVATISGSISNLKLPEGEKIVLILFGVNNPVSGKKSNYTARLNKNNRFYLNIPLECSTALVDFYIQSETKYYGSGCIGLDQSKNALLNIVFDKQGNLKMKTKGGLNLSTVDLMNIPKAINRFIDFNTSGDYYKMTPKEFSELELKVNLKKRISFAIDSLQLTEKIRKYLINTFNLMCLKGRLFYYKEEAEKSHHMRANDSIVYTAVDPDKSYYSFLRDFNLNNPQLLYTIYYGTFMRKLLTIEALKIPPINDTPIDKWLTEVKKGMKDVVGFNKGLFYDMLAVNAYTFQMNDKIEPLSKKQIENIKNYFKLNNKEIISILMKNSKEVVKTLENSKDLKINKILTISSESETDNHNTNKKELTVTIPGNNNVPIKTYKKGADLKVKDSVPASKEKLMETIISKYRGKVVLVDFWATWCVPCKEAISEMKPLKAELKNKEVVFVYISDESSPRIRWEYEIKAIGGEQYYLTKSELNYIIDSFGFNGIPSYLIYDKNGELKHKFNGFPGVDEMKEKIKVLLP